MRDTSPVPAIKAIVLDLDGVLRHFDPDHQAAVEAEHGLKPGILFETGLGTDLARAVTTGEITRQQWGSAIGAAVGSPKAAIDWLSNTAIVDEQMVDLVDQMRRRLRSTTICLLTNGTDETAAELVASGLRSRFDHVFNTSEIRAAKPDPKTYGHVRRVLDLRAGEIFFTDDSVRNVDGAKAAGWHAHHFVGRSTLVAALVELGIDVI